MEEVAMTKRVLLTGAILAGLGVTAGAIWFGRAGGKTETISPSLAGETSSATGAQEPAVPVETVTVAREDLQRTSDSTPGNILPFEKTDLYAKISGYLIDIKKDIGDAVTENEELARIWVPEMDKELEQKKALVLKAQADVERAGALEVSAQAEVERLKSQYGRFVRIKQGGNLDEENVEETRLALEVSKAGLAKAKADVEVAKAQLKLAEAERDQVETLLQYTKIVAPFKGVVTKRNLHTFAFSNARTSEQPLIFTVVRTDKLRVIVDIPETDVRYLEVAHPDKHAVQVTLDAFPGKKFVWKLKRFAPVLNEGKKVRAEVELDNPVADPADTNHKIFLYPGMYAHAAVVLEEKPGALTLPVASLSKDDKGNFVYKVEESKAKKQYVHVGLNDGIKAEITSGLTGHELIISGGKDKVKEGQAVKKRE
jgi:RND family efflux transporter MFP subunit